MKKWKHVSATGERERQRERDREREREREGEREREKERRAMWPRPVNDCIKVNERGHGEREGKEGSGKGTGGGTTDERGTHSA